MRNPEIPLVVIANLCLPEVVHVRDPVAQILDVERVNGDADPYVQIATAVTPSWNDDL